MWETTVMHKQVSGWTVNFGPNSPVYPFLELKTRIPTPPPTLENFRFGMTKVYSEIPPHFGKLQIWDDQSLLRNTPPTPPFGKLQIWDVQSLLRNPPPPFWKTSDLGWPKFTRKYPPTPPFSKTSDLGWPKFTPKYHPHPPLLENFRFGMTKVYSEIPPHPPLLENFRFGMTKVYSEIPPPNRKLSYSSSLRFSEYRELLHVETLSNPDNY